MPYTAVISIAAPQIILESHSGKSMPTWSLSIWQKELPQTVVCMPNQPIPQMAITRPVAIFEPRSPNARVNIAVVGSPRSAPCAPMKYMYIQTSANPAIIASIA